MCIFIMKDSMWKLFRVISHKRVLIGFLITVLPIAAFAQSSGGQIKRPLKSKQVTNSKIKQGIEKDAITDKNYSGTDIIRLISQYLINSKGENYAIPYDIFFINKSLKEERNGIEMEEYGNYSFAKKYRAQLTLDGKSLGGIWYISLRGPQAGAFVLEMQSSTTKDGMEYIKKGIRTNLSGKLIKDDVKNPSIYSTYLYKVKNGYVLLDFNMGAGQVMVSITVSNMIGELENEL